MASKVAERFGRTILELGGNNAIVGAEDSNLDLATRRRDQQLIQPLAAVALEDRPDSEVVLVFDVEEWEEEARVEEDHSEP